METERVENRVRDLRNPEYPVRRIARKSGVRNLIANRRHRALAPEDVYLASYPRSGNTWMKFVFADLVSHREISFNNADEVIPTVGEHASKRGDLRDGGRLLKTHEPFRGEYRRAIYILRDPRDVALSYQRYFEGFGISFGSTDEFAKKFMAGLVGSYGSWMDHLESWFKARAEGAEIMPLFYENLISDPVSLVAEASSFVGVETTAAEVARAVERNSAERMRQKDLALVLSTLYAVALLLYNGGGHDYSLADSVLSVSFIPFFLGQNLAIAILLGQQRFLAYNAARLVPVAAYALFSVVVVVAGSATLTSILVAALCGWILASVISWFQVSRSKPDAEGSPSATRRDIIGFGVRGVVGSVSPIDDVRLDQFMVGILLNAHALGLYVAAIAFCNVQRFVAQAVGAIAYPRVAAERRGPEAWALVRRYFRIGLLAVICVTVPLLLLVPYLLPGFFGSDFTDAVGLGRILLLATFFLSIHRLLTELSRGLGHPGYASISEATNAVVFLILIFLVINPLDEHGVAWAVVAGGIACSSLLGSLLLRLRGPLVAGAPNKEPLSR